MSYKLLRELIERPPELDYDPAHTARNHVPAVIGELIQQGLVGSLTMNLDLGGGPFERGTDAIVDQRGHNAVIDPYARPRSHNMRLLDLLTETRTEGVDTVTLGNVLNVLPVWMFRRQVLQIAHQALRPGGILLASIYEGDRSGAGRRTRDGWQVNLAISDYYWLFREIFGQNPSRCHRSHCLRIRREA